jgi:Uma2 family endonuclease
MPRALLVIEVSVTSRAVDLGRKAAIYAAAGVPEYWVLDLADFTLVVHREPAGDGYRDIAVLTDADHVTAARLPLTVAVAELLPPRR